MNNLVQKLASGVVAGSALLALSTTAQASVAEADGLGTNWLGSVTFNTYANPNVINNPNGAFAAEGNYGSGGAFANGGLAQGFHLSSSGNLNNIQLTMSGGPATFNLLLYDLGTFASYAQGTGAGFFPVANGGSTPNLLSSGLQFTYNGGAGGALNVVQLTFSGLDAITLSSTEEYALALEPASAVGNLTFWSRGGATAGPYGQAYRMSQFSANQYGALNGTVREFGMAVTVDPVPEPSTIALLGLGALVGTFLVRRRID